MNSIRILFVCLALFFGFQIVQGASAPRVLETPFLKIEIPDPNRPILILRSLQINNEFVWDFFYNLTFMDIRELTDDGESLQQQKVKEFKGKWGNVNSVPINDDDSRLMQWITYSYNYTYFNTDGTNRTIPLSFNLTLSPVNLKWLDLKKTSKAYESSTEYGGEAVQDEESAVDEYLKTLGDLTRNNLGLEIKFGAWPFLKPENVLSLRVRITTWINGKKQEKDSLVWKSVVRLGHLDGIEIVQSYSLFIHFLKYALLDSTHQGYVGVGLSDVFDALDLFLNFPSYHDSLYYVLESELADGGVWGSWGLIILLIIIIVAVLFIVGYFVKRWWAKRYEQINDGKRLFD